MGLSQRGQRCKKHAVAKTVHHEGRWICAFCKAAKNETEQRHRAKEEPR